MLTPCCKPLLALILFSTIASSAAAVPRTVTPFTSLTFTTASNRSVRASAQDVTIAIPAASADAGGLAASALGATGAPRIVKISGDGQLTMLGNGFTVPLVVRVEDAAGLPIAGKAITWTQSGNASFGFPIMPATGANGLAEVRVIPGGFFNPGTPFLVYTITATTDVGSVTFGMTSYPITGSVFNPPPVISLIKPAQGNRNITAKLGSISPDAIRALVNSGGGNATNPTPIPGVALNISTGNPDIVARCEGGTPLSGADGIVSCNLIVEGKIGTTELLIDIGALNNFPGVRLTATPGDPAPIILQGNNQSGRPGAVLPISLMVRTTDAYGNLLPFTPLSWTVLPANSATLLNAAAQSDANGNATAQVQLGATPGGVQIKVASGLKESIFTLTIEGVAPAVTISLSPTTRAFSAASNGTAITPPQDVFLTMTGGSNNWTATSNSTWLGVTPATGQGSGRLSVFIVPSALPAPGNYTGMITVNASAAINGPQSVICTLSVKGATSAPFGSFDTPLDSIASIFGPTTVAGNIAVTGWALDDVAVSKVTIWREPVGPEPTHSNGYVYIADGLFVPGARPDVAATYPNIPGANRAGWGYLMLTNGLPNLSGPKGNGSFKLHAFAVDGEGNETKLGTKTIVVNNLNAAKPFGTLDTPVPGQTISGTFLNWGWAMTPQPASIGVDGSTIWVGIDGVNFAHPIYGIKRADIAAAFPGYANSETGVGAYYLDTTKFANGLHNLGWLVYDNLGRGEGIGSRFIQIQNGLFATSAEAPEPLPEPLVDKAMEAERTFQLRTARLQRPAAPTAGYPAFRHGYNLDAALTPIRQAGEGLLEPIELAELERLEIHLPGGQEWTAALRFGDELRAVPIGSTFDAEGGIFYWQLGPVFLGEYVLEFRAADGTVLPVPVRVGHPLIEE